ncbi:MAG TPA: SDR family NAD(P)-dependent oxidoreductase [Bacteroidales bacterium]|nr:SDR family NAD(P)-dependent oxidoreductase [Bacteroidales bacterium]HPS62571.1 SDR family NAD(P)-dependent oxidoreductase [Bacteroidales bacterium]
MNTTNGIVLVTGGNRGIGCEICRQLALKGYTVIMGSRNYRKGIAAASSMEGTVIVKKLDVRRNRDVNELANWVAKEYGKLDVLINNAGVGATIASRLPGFLRPFLPLARKVKPMVVKAGLPLGNATVSTVSLPGVKSIMDTNFYGPWLMIQAFISLLEKSGQGHIINVSSGMGEWVSLNGEYPGYRLSKVSLNALTVMFSRELSEKGIRVNAICPGWVRTDMGGAEAPLTVGQGADTAVWLAEEKEGATGRFFRGRREINW